MDMRTISLGQYDYGLDELLARVDELAAQGVKVINIQSIYDNGAGRRSANYPIGKLWSGLAIYDLQMPNIYFSRNASTDGDIDARWAGVDALLERAHANCQKVMSWLNPSYIVQTSTLYNDDPGPNHADTKFSWLGHGECDSDGHCCSANKPKCTVSFSDKARTKPLLFVSHSRTLSECNNYIWDPRKGACVYSYWANQPTADFATQAWKEYLHGALDLWMQRGLDGFTLDYPLAYDHIGTDGGKLYSDIVVKVKSYNSPPRLLLSEVYFSQSDPLWFAKWAGLDGALDDPFGNFALYSAIDSQDASKAEAAWNGVDAAMNQCYLAPAGSIGGACPMAWLRLGPRTSGSDQAAGNALARATAAAGGYITAVEYLNNQSPYWSPERWPGDDEEASVQFLRHVANTRAASAGGFSPLALRAPAYSNGKHSGDAAHIYAMVKYDAFGMGQMAVFAANFGAPHSVAYDVLSSMPTRVRQLAGGAAVGGDTLQLAPYTFGWRAMPRALPIWSQWGEVGNTNCYNSHAKQYFIGDNRKMSLGSCLLHCLGDTKFECKAVVVLWNQFHNSGGLLSGCWGQDSKPGALACHHGSTDKSGYTTLTF